ncbi:hypothetical protein DSO57_1005154 [Entomophthora muscae]|uniref:Uncharacterized protein n=1 Tax=Entomophthora muscae TaxID=34485 RepID=A0ACC2TVN9_9FUNG|nr:hypothetical protein DSO57_1005154 [Entomophthora muscae]
MSKIKGMMVGLAFQNALKIHLPSCDRGGGRSVYQRVFVCHARESPSSEAHEVAGGSGRVKRSHDSNIINRSKARCPRFESCVVEELHSTIPY